MPIIYLQPQDKLTVIVVKDMDSLSVRRSEQEQGSEHVYTLGSEKVIAVSPTPLLDGEVYGQYHPEHS